MTKAIVVINEQHSLMAEQTSILNEQFESVELLKVPANGWNLGEIKEVCYGLDYQLMKGYAVVFASPIPSMIKMLCVSSTSYEDVTSQTIQNIFVFHNDRREKKELPGGKIIFTVSETGWELV